MRPPSLAFALVLVSSAALAQTAADPSVVSYLYVDGRQVPLTPVANAPFYRIHADAKMADTAAVRERMEPFLERMEVRPTGEELAVRKSVQGAADARRAIGTLTRIQEADQLRVFTTDGGASFLIEYPEIILQCDERTTLEEVSTYLRQHYQVTVAPTGLHDGQFLVRLTTPAHTLWLANQLRSTTAIPVRYADVNFFLAQPAGGNPPAFPQQWPTPLGSPLPNDPAFGDQWALENRAVRPKAVRGADIGFARALRVGPLDASGMTIAVLDYAIDVDHPELHGAVAGVFNATRYDPRRGMTDPALRTLDFDTQPEEDADHGTAAAGIIAALSSNGTGISGVAPGARIMAIQIARPTTSDVKLINGLTIYAALEAARQAAVDVVSLSWGLRLPTADALQSVEEEIAVLNRARNGKGILVVSAAGNDRFNIPTPDFPAELSSRMDNVLAAGASNWCGTMKRPTGCDSEAWTSRFNPNTLFAPGVDILTITNRRDSNVPNALNNYRANFNGTSAATPFIAAGAALVMKQHPDWTASRVRRHLMETAAKLQGGGQPELDICNALHGAAQCAIPASGP